MTAEMVVFNVFFYQQPDVSLTFSLFIIIALVDCYYLHTSN